ncbi:hypothetical protein N9219_05365 [bacterium]|nr:hypothetical protein [bacterium]
MEKAAPGRRNILINFAWFSLIATGIIIFSDLTNAYKDSEAASPEGSSQNGAAIRMKHQWRGNCYQCHLPDRPVDSFQR